jgi:hypothetical protein
VTPIEQVIQRLMEPDKHGEKGRPVRGTLTDTFGHPVQRTLDALWKFAEGTAIASRDSKDHYDSAVARIGELEEAMTHAVAWMELDGCDCGVSENGSCALCVCKSLLTKP